MQKLIISNNDLGYYLLIVDMAMIVEEPEQLELDFENDENENSAVFEGEEILY